VCVIVLRLLLNKDDSACASSFAAFHSTHQFSGRYLSESRDTPWVEIILTLSQYQMLTAAEMCVKLTGLYTRWSGFAVSPVLHSLELLHLIRADRKGK
jgi:hypothetical protein